MQSDPNMRIIKRLRQKLGARQPRRPAYFQRLPAHRSYSSTEAKGSRVVDLLHHQLKRLQHPNSQRRCTKTHGVNETVWAAVVVISYLRGGLNFALILTSSPASVYTCCPAVTLNQLLRIAMLRLYLPHPLD
jgi:hypothetical protein